MKKSSGGRRETPPSIAAASSSSVAAASAASSSSSVAAASAASSASPSAHFKFKITGKVQGVYFRNFTKKTADSLGIFGWVENKEDGSVQGEAVGEKKKMELLRSWLKNTGSPKSRIDSAKFTDLQVPEETKFSSFEVNR